MGWKEPQTNKELQSFVGLANFYHRMIKGHAAIAAPLTSIMATPWDARNGGDLIAPTAS